MEQPKRADDDLLERLRRFEVEFPADFTGREARPWGVLFHCRDNAESHDSNHAVVLDLQAADPSNVIREITSFYRERGITPRIYSAGVPGEEEALHPPLREAGYVIQHFESHWFLLEGESRVTPNPALEVRRIRVLDGPMRALINSDGEAPWSERVVERHLGYPDYYLLAGYIGGTPVTMASVKYREGIGRVDDVLTDPAHRGRGHVRSLMHHLVRLHRESERGLLHLWTDNPVAMRAYRDVGFVELKPSPTYWSAMLP